MFLVGLMQTPDPGREGLISSRFLPILLHRGSGFRRMKKLAGPSTQTSQPEISPET